MDYRYTVFNSPFGTHFLLAGDKGLVALSLGESWDKFRERYQELAPGTWRKVKSSELRTLKRAVESLQAYFKSGRPLTSDVSLDLRGTAFQRKVWNTLRRIPHGKTVSYGDIAKNVGAPKAARAVGSACGSNPIPLFIPCHRVVAGNGGLGGFGGGLRMKEQLLKLESLG